MKKNVIYAAAASLLLGLAACSDELNGDDRFMANPNPPVQDTTGFVKRFVVEDFTGQRCTNCPSAARMLAALKEETYGDRMILVAMHAGGELLSGPLRNEKAQVYMDALNLMNNPAMSVDRVFSTDGVGSTWAEQIAQRSTVSTPCEVTQYVSRKSEREIQVVASVEFSDDYSSRLGVQHWILEDSIIDIQLDNGFLNTQYVHNHVFRDCLYEDVWGLELAGEAEDVYNAGETYMSAPSLDYTIPDEWDVEHVSVVSFVFRYSDDDANPMAEIVQANIVHL